jgi:hypothetical protein
LYPLLAIFRDIEKRIITSHDTLVLWVERIVEVNSKIGDFELAPLKVVKAHFDNRRAEASSGRTISKKDILVREPNFAEGTESGLFA